MRSIFPDLLERQGEPAAIATLVDKTGSAPLPVGSAMVVWRDGTVRGWISGGCVDSDVVAVAERVLLDGVAEIREYGPPSLMGVGLTCGGQLRVLVEPVYPELLTAAAAVVSDRAVTLSTDLSTGSHSLSWSSGEGFSLHGSTFVAGFAPRPLLVIVSATAVTNPLAQLASSFGWRVVVVEHRPVFAAQISCDVVPRLDGLVLDRRSAVAVLSHDPMVDVPAIMAAFAASCGYVGAMGSAVTHVDRVRRLRAAGASDGDLARLRSPIGSAGVGGRSPVELAVAIGVELGVAAV
ncbi:XdhC family protein [Allokutzneria sp. A3M-2-11 16]|uniref:XdhC family protein n=1 Tax=Allokutzneria sp. A3M-2-11 16 TaxID=2962043 RepID=UPI0020B8B2E0|nr:XdhC family protein [Allokutzneria sp. A3M-2-11 16]MCP3802269.1 XdhC family protein [Allokutzneria sp. A3M-2-11 16]